MVFQNANPCPWQFERDKSVLLVIDLVNDFVREGAIMEVKEARRQIPRVKKLINVCRELEVPVIYTIQATDATFTPLEVKVMPWLKEAGMREGTEGAQVYDEIAPLPGEKVIQKRRFSAFYNTDLEIILRNIRGGFNQVDTIIICGTVSNVCCEAAARDAFYRDYQVVFGSDINAAHDQEAHNATLRNMAIFGRVLSCDEIIEALRKGLG